MSSAGFRSNLFIHSLILSNHDHTPEQFQLFFSKFHLERLTQLYSITLIDMEHQILLKFIDLLNDVNHCPHLQSLKISSELYSYSKLPQKLLKNICSRPLKRLEINEANLLDIFQLVHVQVLTIHNCSVRHFEDILRSIPTLVSFKIKNLYEYEDRLLPIHQVPIGLKRLVLNLGKIFKRKI